MQALEVLRQVCSSEVIISNKPQVFPEAASDGDVFRQGDVYIFRRDKLPRGAKATAVSLQLAPGDTKGSRHCLDSSEGVEMYHVNGDALQGPFLSLSSTRTITHPEHGHVICPPGVYEVTYQRAYAEELRRVRD
jgi:hypothetical protein